MDANRKGGSSPTHRQDEWGSQNYMTSGSHKHPSEKGNKSPRSRSHEREDTKVFYPEERREKREYYRGKSSRNKLRGEKGGSSASSRDPSPSQHAKGDRSENKGKNSRWEEEFFAWKNKSKNSAQILHHYSEQPEDNFSRGEESYNQENAYGESIPSESRNTDRDRKFYGSLNPNSEVRDRSNVIGDREGISHYDMRGGPPSQVIRDASGSFRETYGAGGRETYASHPSKGPVSSPDMGNYPPGIGYESKGSTKPQINYGSEVGPPPFGPPVLKGHHSTSMPENGMLLFPPGSVKGPPDSNMFPGLGSVKGPDSMFPPGSIKGPEYSTSNMFPNTGKKGPTSDSSSMFAQGGTKGPPIPDFGPPHHPRHFAENKEYNSSTKGSNKPEGIPIFSTSNLNSGTSYRTPSLEREFSRPPKLNDEPPSPANIIMNMFSENDEGNNGNIMTDHGGPSGHSNYGHHTHGGASASASSGPNKNYTGGRDSHRRRLSSSSGFSPTNANQQQQHSSGSQPNIGMLKSMGTDRDPSKRGASNFPYRDPRTIQQNSGRDPQGGRGGEKKRIIHLKKKKK